MTRPRALEAEQRPAAVDTRSDTLVSVVVPVYNGERFLRQSLDSILSQTYPHLELLVIDDASTDSTAEIVRSYADPRLRYERQLANRGIFANVNDGIALTRGELVAVYHADDVYHPSIVEREVGVLMQNERLGAVFAIDRFIDERGCEFGRLTLPSEFRRTRPLEHRDVLNGFLRYGNSFIRCPTCLARRTLYDETGPYDTELGIQADLDMWLRMARRRPLAVIDEHLVAYRWGHDNSSARYERLRTDPETFFTIIDRALADCEPGYVDREALETYEGRRAHDLLVVSRNLYLTGEPRRARGMVARVAPARILAARRLRRSRLLVAWLVLRIVSRLPRLELVARILSWGSP